MSKQIIAKLIKPGSKAPGRAGEGRGQAGTTPKPSKPREPPGAKPGAEGTGSGSGPRRGRGNRGNTKYTRKTSAERKRRIKSQSDWLIRVAGRDIGKDKEGNIIPLGDTIDWPRRFACERDLRTFCKTYLPNVFTKSWADYHLALIRKMETVILGDGLFALAVPRGGGKTALCRASILWATAYAHRRFPYFLGSQHDKAIQTLEFIKLYWYRSRLLREDFPEVAWAAYHLENRSHLARSQLYLDQPTHIEWGTESIRYPCLLLPENLARPYLDNPSRHDKEPFVTEAEGYDGSYIARSAGIVIGTAGIDGSIRGEAEVHPITLEQPRPDLALLDDIQKDQKAESPAACDKLVRLIDGAIQYLSGPGKTIAALMPCTVIREGDVSDTYLDPLKKPEWRGERFSMVSHWPPGITNSEITLETEAGKLWDKYGELRKQSLRLYEDIRLATKLYRKNRKIMDQGFTVTWTERFDPKRELSAQQHAMNLRLTNPLTFASECQNRPRRLEEGGPMMITAGELVEKTIAIPRRCLQVDCQHLTAFIDVQNEILFYAVFGCSPEFTGIISDYGTWPEVHTRFFNKGQTEGWSLLTKEFFLRYPDQRSKAIRTEGGKLRAPLEAKIYHALSQAVPWLLSLEFIRQDDHQTPMRIQRLAIDTRWGQVSDVIKRYCRECGSREVVPYFGQSFPPTNKQLEEYTRTKGWLFEDQVNPQVKEVKWVYRPDQGGLFHLTADVNRLKDFLFARLSSPLGSPGSVALFQGPPEAHEQFARHICDSEYPEPVTARGMTKNQWKERDGRPDNDWLDCSVGCLALASFRGAYLRTDRQSQPPPRKRRRISAVWKTRRGEE